MLKARLLLLLLALGAGTASAQVTFTTSGTWTVPAGVTSVTVEVVGAGGNGTSNGRGGGGGGGYASGTFTVVPNATHTITVGTGGSTTVTSVSGLGIQATAGANAATGTTGAGGAGGVGSGGTINRTGGTGGTGTYTYFGGGGGGAAGPTANGGNGGATPAWNGNNCLQTGGAPGTSGGAPGGAGGKGAGFTDNSCNVANPAAPGASYGGGGGGGNGNSSPAANGAGGYVSITWGGCTPPAAPTGTATQTFCSSNAPTVANLTATGTSIQWYAAATGGTPLAGTTGLVNNTTYYATQTISGCESTTRLGVTATVTTTPVPTGTATQSFCSGSANTVANLAATGTGIQWYAAATGGSPLAGTTPLVNNTVYYASQTVSGCESSTRLAVTATITAAPAAPTGTATQTFCSGATPTVANLAATGTGIQWYAAATGGTPLAGASLLVNSTTYYASQTVSGCESSTRLAVTATVTPSPAMPTGSGTQLFCSADTPTVADLTATGTGIQWYAAATGGTPLATTTGLVNNTTYYASQTVSGCESDNRLLVTVAVVTVNATATAASNVLTAGAVTGGTYQWINCNGNLAIPNATAATYTATANGNYAVVVTVNGCRDTSSCVTVSGVGIGEVKGARGVSLYPNPARDVITVQADAALNGTDYRITDGAGRKVKGGRLTGEKTEISIRELPAGLYHFSIGGQGQQTFTVQKQ